MGHDSEQPPPLQSEIRGLIDQLIAEALDGYSAQEGYPMGPDTSDMTAGEVVGHIGFTMVRNDHHQRILNYCHTHDPGRALAVLGLYVHMSSKPPGWQFSADRLGKEVHRNRKAIGADMSVLRDMGYISTARVQDTHGRWSSRTTFSSQLLGPEVPATEVPSGVSGVTSGNSTNVQVAPKTPNRPVGDRPSGLGSVKSELSIRTISQSVSQPETSPPTEAPAGADMTDDTWNETAMTAVIDMLDPRIRPAPTRQITEQLRWNGQQGWTAATLAAHIAANVNPDKAGPGAVVALLRNLGAPPTTHTVLSEADRHPSSENLTGLASRQARARQSRQASA